MCDVLKYKIQWIRRFYYQKLSRSYGVCVGKRQNIIIPMSKETGVLRVGYSEDVVLLASAEDFGSYADEWRYETAGLAYLLCLSR